MKKLILFISLLSLSVNVMAADSKAPVDRKPASAQCSKLIAQYANLIAKTLGDSVTAKAKYMGADVRGVSTYLVNGNGEHSYWVQVSENNGVCSFYAVSLYPPVQAGSPTY